MSQSCYFWNISYSYTLACSLAGPIRCITKETASHIHGNSLPVNAAADITVLRGQNHPRGGRGSEWARARKDEKADVRIERE